MAVRQSSKAISGSSGELSWSMAKIPPEQTGRQTPTVVRLASTEKLEIERNRHRKASATPVKNRHHLRPRSKSRTRLVQAARRAEPNGNLDPRQVQFAHRRSSREPAGGR